MSPPHRAPPPRRAAPPLLASAVLLLALLLLPAAEALQPDPREQYQHRYTGESRGWPRPFPESGDLRGAGEGGVLPDSSDSLVGASPGVLPPTNPSSGLGSAAAAEEEEEKEQEQEKEAVPALGPAGAEEEEERPVADAAVADAAAATAAAATAAAATAAAATTTTTATATDAAAAAPPPSSGPGGVGIAIDPQGKFGGDPTKNDPLSVTSLWGIGRKAAPGGGGTTLGVRPAGASAVVVGRAAPDSLSSSGSSSAPTSLTAPGPRASASASRRAVSAAPPPALAAGAATAPSDFTTSPGLIPRSVLFGNPRYAAPKLSPDGRFLAYLAPSADLEVLNVFVREVGGAGAGAGPAEATQVTSDRSRGIRSYFWGQDSRTLLYLQDDGGDENFHLWAVDAATDAGVLPPGGAGPPRDLTPGRDVKASNIVTSERHPDEIMVATNARDPAAFDMYRCRYGAGSDGTLVLVAENPGDVVSWSVEDRTFEVRGATVRNQADSSTTVRVRSGERGAWRDLVTFPFGEDGGLVDFLPDGSGQAWLESSLGGDTTALLRVDLDTGKIVEVKSSRSNCDVGGVTLDRDTKEVRAVGYNYARIEREFFDDELARDYAILEGLAPEGAEVGVSSRSRDETMWVVNFQRSDGPTEFVLYDQVGKTIEPLFVSKPDLLGYKLALMEDVRIRARDGLEMVGYLTRARATSPTPLVLLVHGGPWARDAYGFNAQAQWFANRGYATLQVNYRGSTGYGKTFLHKGDGQWGVGDMQHDLTDAVRWAIEEGIADADNVCIYGGSYGGYACLAGLAFTPDLYKCGVDIVGPSNVKTLLDSIPPYWAPLRNGMLIKIGDVDGDEELNRRISPLYHVDSIAAPLLIGQGANDPRVKQAEADQIAFSMRDKGIPVEYCLYPDEGHGFARPDNRIDFNGRAEQFLAKHLGGRAEAFVKPEGSTVIFPLEADE